MDVLMYFVILAWGVRIIHNVVAYVQLWWVKEYRFDRMRIHLKTDQGKRIYFLAFRGLRISLKTISLVALSFISLGVLYQILPFHPLLRLLIVDIASLPVTAILVLLVSIPQWFYHRIIIALATQKLRSRKNLFVVGITGSYGKTSTKEYLATILSAKFKMLKTRASKNSAIGIAEVVLRDLKPEHNIFVMEMGAYKVGEIEQMTRMVQPQVGIITAINEQHQDLFGSIENTMKAKYELLAGLTGKRIAIMNGDNAHIKKMVDWAKCDGLSVWTYGSQGQFQLSNIIQEPRELTFTVTRGKQMVKVHANVTGTHQAHNITAAIAGAVAFGMSLTDAAKAASGISPVDRMMKPVVGINGSTFIDDTFNNNPDAAIAAIDYLAATKGKKILVFQPMIELGSYADSAHKRVGEAASKVCDAIILTNRDYYEYFMSGVTVKDMVHVFSPQKADAYIRKAVKSGDTVLFKGKEAEKVLHSLV